MDGLKDEKDWNLLDDWMYLYDNPLECKKNIRWKKGKIFIPVGSNKPIQDPSNFRHQENYIEVLKKFYNIKPSQYLKHVIEVETKKLEECSTY